MCILKCSIHTLQGSGFGPTLVDDEDVEDISGESSGSGQTSTKTQHGKVFKTWIHICYVYKNATDFFWFFITVPVINHLNSISLWSQELIHAEVFWLEIPKLVILTWEKNAWLTVIANTLFSFFFDRTFNCSYNHSLFNSLWTVKTVNSKYHHRWIQTQMHGEWRIRTFTVSQENVQ